MNSYDFQGLKFLFYMFENIEVMPIKWMKVFFFVYLSELKAHLSIVMPYNEEKKKANV